jgi:hypothetical protein
MRQKVLRDMADPRCKKSRTDREEASLTKPNTDIEAPMRNMERMDIEDPI